MTALSRAEQAVALAREQVWLRPCDQTIDALITAVRAWDAEVVRALPLADFPDDVREVVASRVEAPPPPEVEVRYAYGPALRLADFTVTTDAETGRVDVVGRPTTSTAWPPPGDAVPLTYLDIPGRGALADVTARIEHSGQGDDTLVRIRVNINAEEQQ